MAPDSDKPKATRRDFLKSTGTATAGAALASTLASRAYAADSSTIQLALIGCGGRGSGAVGNALSAPGGPVKLVAMADINDQKLAMSHRALTRRYEAKVDVPEDRMFLGFDAYKKAIDCLKPGDVAMLTAFAYCRPTHMAYAIKKGVNVFMEKSFAADPGGSHRMLKIGEEADRKGLKVAAGVMCRHSVARQEMIKKVRDGEFGDLLLIRASRLWGGRGLRPRPADTNELIWQIRNKSAFTWVTSGHMSEMLIHQIDECCWLKDSFPVSCHALGGRLAHDDDCGQNQHVFAMEYTFADGTKAIVNARSVSGAHNEFATFVHGTKKAGQFSGKVHAATVQTYKDQRISNDNITWKADKEPCSPWQAEWNVLLDKIRKNEPHNETKRAVYTNLTTIMGREAANINNTVTWDQVYNSKFQFCDYIDDLTEESPAPVHADDQGRYPAPIPGKWKAL